MDTGVSKGSAVGAPKTRLGLAVIAAAIAIAPFAAATPGDPDPEFGTDGFYKFPAGDRYHSVDAPIVQESGRIVVAGLLRNQSEKIFLAGLTPNGAPDTSF